jgi:hypothetical protein
VTDSEKRANDFLNGARLQWSALVELVRTIPPREIEKAAKALASGAGVDHKALYRKMQAINLAMAEKMTNEEIISASQRKILGKYIQTKRAERTEPLVRMSWLVSPELKKEVERGLWNVGLALGTNRSENIWEFVGSQMNQWSEEEIKHSAGMYAQAPSHKDRQANTNTASR